VLGESKLKQTFLLLLPAAALLSCSSSPHLERLARDLDEYPEYSIILEDMKEEGNFFDDYYHRYKIIHAERNGSADSLRYKSELTAWLRVSQREYEKYDQYLGMTIAAKTRAGEHDFAQHPPGYEYVGDPAYGSWRADDNGNSFWEFYGQYALMSSLFGMMTRPIYYNDWQGYRDSRSRGQPYFGRNREFGTNGAQTKEAHKSFFERRLERDRLAKQRFSQKVQDRVRRSNMSRMRSRSSRGFGK
jgi:hypothetical protein